MEELSIEKKAKAYDEAREKIAVRFGTNVAEEIFSEFEESEDERIRKGLINYFNHHKNGINIFYGIKGDDILAWLEKQGEPQDKGEISDGYHTFNELYYYRMLYNAAFFNMLPKEWVHKSKRHNDGEECFGGGWFIVMANLPTGQISNHYELKDWDLFQIPEKEVADKWDGHTPQEAADRLHKYLLEKQDEQKQEINNFDVLPGLYKCVHRMFDGTPDGRLLFEVGNVYKCLSKHDRAEFEVSYGHSVYLEDPVVCKHFIPFEKQSEQKPIIEMKTPGESLGIDSDTYNKIVDECIYGENKPKFKVGDWIIHKDNKHIPIKIIEKIGMYYRTVDTVNYHHNLYIDYANENYRLWATQDAKDGDALINDFHLIFVFKEIKNNMYVSHCSIIDRGNDIIVNSVAEREVGDVNLVKCQPATKEQYDLLFSKMKEAGYEWDAENKELKKIERKPADKVESKFKVGDWIVFNGLTLYIKEVVKGYYRTISKGGITNSYDWGIDNVARLWTIQDAKDGDVLACENGWACIFNCLNDNLFSSHCFIDNEGWFCGDEGQVHMLDTITCGEIHPATKEQHDLLFQKMKEAGYEWDAEKKEPKKIEQKTADKVESKFKVGDWVVYYRNDSSREVLQVYDIRDGRYYFTDNVHFSWSVKECDEKSHLWTIKDAKEGDVLAEDTCTFIIKKLNHDRTAKIYCCLHDDGDFELNSNLGFDDTCTYPATEEQRDLLFEKMKEAGYQWDADKKELKKFHIIDEGKAEMDYCFTKMMNGEKVNSTWSEEDDKMLVDAYVMLDWYKGNNWWTARRIKDWLKSLKQRIGG